MIEKQTIFNALHDLINSQVKAYQETLDDLAESAANETKSTAGDKHETALAMLQIEQRNVKIRFIEAQEKKKQLEKINLLSSSHVVVKGSLVHTNKGLFFLSVALGKILINGETIMAISPQSPLGIKLLGKKLEDVVEVNGIRYTIELIG